MAPQPLRAGSVDGGGSCCGSSSVESLVHHHTSSAERSHHRPGQFEGAVEVDQFERAGLIQAAADQFTAEPQAATLGAVLALPVAIQGGGVDAHHAMIGAPGCRVMSKVYSLLMFSSPGLRVTECD